MSLVGEQWLFLKDVAKLIGYAESQGFVLTGGELFRTAEQQALHVKAGRSKTFQSNHLNRLAIDFNIFKDGVLLSSEAVTRPLGVFWESLDTKNRWGGNFKVFYDQPHFERNV